jgi:hypothetical protein
MAGWSELHRGYLSASNSAVGVHADALYLHADLTVDEIEQLPLPPGTERVVADDGQLLGFRDTSGAAVAALAADVRAGESSGGGVGSPRSRTRAALLTAEHPLLRMARERAERLSLPQGWQAHTTVLPDGTCRPFYTRHAKRARAAAGVSGVSSSSSSSSNSGGGGGGRGGGGSDGGDGALAAGGTASGAAGGYAASSSSHAERDYSFVGVDGFARHFGGGGAGGSAGGVAGIGHAETATAVGAPSLRLRATWQHPMLRQCLEALLERLAWCECAASEDELQGMAAERGQLRRAAQQRRDAEARKRQISRDLEREAASIAAMLGQVHSKFGLTPVKRGQQQQQQQQQHQHQHQQQQQQQQQRSPGAASWHSSSDEERESGDNSPIGGHAVRGWRLGTDAVVAPTATIGSKVGTFRERVAEGTRQRQAVDV